MHRLLFALAAGVLAGGLTGCDNQTQPNAPTAPEAVTPDFAKQTADMMKKANTGMDPKKAKADAAASK